MASYLSSLFFNGPASPKSPPTSGLEAPGILRISPPASDEDIDDTEREDDDDTPSAFPALSSAQRLPSARLPKFLTDAELMPPPPNPTLASRRPGVPSSSTASSTLALPPSTTRLAVTSSKRKGKVALAPGHSTLDWANLKSSGRDLRGVPTLHQIALSELKRHNRPDDAWTAIGGKVYNITSYLPFHPGGEKELMRVAGRDGSKLFGNMHPWVNVDHMLDACMVGFLVPDSRVLD